MRSSIRFSAEPSWPISVWAPAGSTRTIGVGRFTSPLSNSRSATSRAAAATLDNGASWRRMIRMPAVVAPISATAATTQNMPSTHSSVSSTTAVGRPVTMRLPAVPGVQADQPIAAKAVELDGLRPPVGGNGGELGGGGGAHPGPATVCGDDARVHRAVPRDDRANGPRSPDPARSGTRGLGRAPGRAAPGRRIPAATRADRAMARESRATSPPPVVREDAGARERWRRHVEDRGRTPARLEQLSVELMGSGSASARTRSQRRCRCTRPRAGAPG